MVCVNHPDQAYQFPTTWPTANLYPPDTWAIALIWAQGTNISADHPVVVASEKPPRTNRTEQSTKPSNPVKRGTFGAKS